MKIKFIYGLLGLLISLSVSAIDGYQYMGEVSSYATDTGVTTINGQEYQVNNDTKYHQATQRGELGPIFSKGQTVGFNVIKNSSEHPRISEVWFLSN